MIECLWIPNPFVRHDAVVVALHALDRIPEDCSREVFSWLPTNVQRRCEHCGVPLAYSDAHGRVYTSESTKYSARMCCMCYNTIFQS